MGVRKAHLIPEHLTFEFVFKAVNAQEIKKEEDFYKQFYPHLIQYSSGQVENLRFLFSFKVVSISLQSCSGADLLKYLSFLRSVYTSLCKYQKSIQRVGNFEWQFRMRKHSNRTKYIC